MPVWRFAANSLLQMVDEELVYLANNLLDILLDKICLDMCSAWNDKESLVCRASSDIYLLSAFSPAITSRGWLMRSAWSVASHAIISINELFR